MATKGFIPAHGAPRSIRFRLSILKDDLSTQDQESVAGGTARDGSGGIFAIAGKVACADEGIPGAEEHLVEGIIGSQGELQLHPFGNGKRLGHRRIQIAVGLAAE